MDKRIVGACCLINVYASGVETSILQAVGGFYITEQVQSEALTIRQPDADDPSKLIPMKIDLSAATVAGLINQCRLESGDETDAFVRFAMELDDGEASCLAVAESRGWIVATDDRKAIRIAENAEIAVITTPELIQKWIGANSPDEDEISGALRRIEQFARFRPRRTSPFYPWWTGLSEREEK